RMDDILNTGDAPIHDLCGYLATPLTGLSPSMETEQEKVIESIRNVAHGFHDPKIDLYWPGQYTHPLRNANFTAEQVYLTDRARASSHDFIVLFCGSPSYGVGQENEIATQAGVPAIRIAPAKLSRMMGGSFLQAIDVSYDGSLETEIHIDVC